MRARKSIGAAIAVALAGGFASIAPAAMADELQAEGSGQGKKNGLYIVRMAENPVVAYDGGIAGYQATKPRKGTKINPNDPKVVRYAAYLDSRHDEAVARVGGSKAQSYRYSFNGFAAKLTQSQANLMKSLPGVLAVEQDELLQMDTSTTTAFLGLSGASGMWASTGAKGENVVIGIVDSGAWPEHPSFSDRTGTNGNATQDGKLGYQQIPGWHGKCTPGEGFSGTDCNHKLIGARYYNAGWGGSAQVKANWPFEYISPRDWGGHGTHTATTAGGNEGVQATGLAAALGKISGIAPRARIAAYKVCWADQPTGGGCWGTDSVSAIDQAVADGVDVINFSISGSRTNFRDAVEIAFMFAADAGVFVAASAGNSGPTTSTVAHPGPWLTTVAAGTHNRDGTGTLTLGDGSSYGGASFANALPSTPMILSSAAGLAGADATMVRLCFSAADNVVAGVPTPVLDPAKVAGKIVLCERGSNALINKSGAVAAAGGAGAVIYNVAASVQTTLAIIHTIPTIHVNTASGTAITTYASSAAAPTGAIGQSTIVNTAAAPLTASFSSRGPMLAGAGDLLKPDLIAPGQDILAGVAPPNNAGKLFDLYSGTSMSSPHVAGLAALFKEIHPDWSPMAIKSALMTTGNDVIDTDAGPNTATRIFRQGAGHVRPSLAVNPGLVFDAGFTDWLNFICGVQPGAGCAAGQGIDPSDYNAASIAVGDLLSSQTVKRRVTNVSGASASWTASHTGMAGYTVAVSPPAFTLAPGASQDLSITITRGAAPLNSYTGGQLTFTGGPNAVRIPMVVRPVALSAPTVQTYTAAGGSYPVKFGYTGAFTATARGLVAPNVTSGTVAQDPDQTFDPASADGTFVVPVTLPAGTTYARFSLFDADVTAGTDLDIYVYNGGSLLASGALSGSNEEVNVSVGGNGLGAPITLTVYIHGWGVTGGTTPFKLNTWLVGNTPAGNMTIAAPASAVMGSSGTIGVSFTGLVPGTKYLGSVVYGGATGLPGPTLINVNP
jgi:hypothetical protein